MTENSETAPCPSFAGLPRADSADLHGARVAILGAGHGSPYQPGVASHAADGPSALRRGSQLFAKQLSQFDFDLGGVLQAAPNDGAIVDCGDLALGVADGADNRARITQAVAEILDANVIPVVLGGDDSIPIPVFAAYEGRGPMTMVQIDAHVDWGDEIQGNRFGYGSPMRRASEMPWITGMVQFGIRGLGSGTPDQLKDARAWGSRIVTMPDLRRDGLAAALAALPDGGDCFVTIDCDALDPAVLPAVNMPTPGGLLYQDVLDILQGVANKGRIAGVTLVELVPARDDTQGLSAMVAARIALSAIGLAAMGPHQDFSARQKRPARGTLSAVSAPAYQMSSNRS